MRLYVVLIVDASAAVASASARWLAAVDIVVVLIFLRFFWIVAVNVFNGVGA